MSAAPPFVTNVMQATRLDTVFRMYGSEEEAIVSFLKDTVSRGEEAPTGPRVLFVDPSADVCAFVRVLLNNHGYAVLSSCRVGDAKLLLLSGTFNYLVLGTDYSQGEAAASAEKLTALAKSAAVLQLSSTFNYEDPERAGAELLRLLRAAKAAGA